MIICEWCGMVMTLKCDVILNTTPEIGYDPVGFEMLFVTSDKMIKIT